MSIKSETFSLCKKIWELEIRESIHKLIPELNSSSKANIGTGRDRSHFGYIARKQNAQFLGYIMVDEKRGEIEKEPFPTKVPILSESEKELLMKTHFIFEYLNEQCISTITKQIPNTTQALNPYSQFSYSKPYFNINEIIDQNILNSLVTLFHSLEIIKNILNIPIKLSKRISLEHYLSATSNIIKRLEKYGVHNTPEDFNKIQYKVTKNSPEHLIQRLLFSIISIRKILANVNQLLYQAFLSNKLIILNEDNIIDIRKHNSHYAGEGLTILIQPLRLELFSELGDIILVKCDINTQKLDKLCVVEGINVSMNNDFGTTQEYRLRVMDDNLNSFFGLLKH